MLRHMNLQRYATNIETACFETIKEGKVRHRGIAVNKSIFFQVSMTGDVKYPTHGVNVFTVVDSIL